MRKFFVICWLLILFVAVCSLFWYQEWKYSLPTPVPVHYSEVKVGETVNLDGSMLTLSKSKPSFIHFFNPDCPCSRFNIPHFKSLVKKYGNVIDFSVVVFDRSGTHTAGDIESKYDLSVPITFDTTIAARCGVYATPQAVLLDADRKLYYRGNYNRNRYCTDQQSNFAQQAIDSLLDHHPRPLFSQYALKAYGCQLSYCSIDSLKPPK